MRLAGLPYAVGQRAKIVLSQLDGMPAPQVQNDVPTSGGGVEGKLQMSLISPPPLPNAPNRIEQDLRSARIDEMTPLQALNFLNALRTKLPKR